MKKLPAIIAALATTGLILAAILIIGVNSFIKPASAAAASNPSITGDASLAQLQDLVAQYQARETQYQALLSQSQADASQAEAQLQQYEDLFTQLQQMGVIQVQNNGQISVFRPRSRGFENDN